MPHAFTEIAFTDAVKALQEQDGSRASYARFERGPDLRRRFGDAERAFVEAAESFYIATANPDGWPYIQHRGGPAGFVHVKDPETLLVPDYAGNRQFVTMGNLQGSAQASLFFMDYANKRRLKVFAEATLTKGAHPSLAGGTPPPERTLTLKIRGYDWNCPQYIPDLYGPEAIAAATAQITAADKARIAELEAEVARLKER